MASITETCIYCDRPIDPTRGEGDHIIPAQLGEFRGDLRFRRICRDCNSRIGRSEQQFLQCGPENRFRSVVQPAAPRRRRKRGRSTVGGAHGMPSPKVVIRMGGHSQIVDTEGPDTAIPVDQLVVRAKDGTDQHFRLFPGMRPEQLRERVAKRGIADFDSARVHCHDGNWEEYQALAAGAWPKMRMTEEPATEAGVHEVEARTTFRVSDHYFRVIAKIAFHYYLVHARRGFRGDEPEFEPLRRFILEGGDWNEFFGRPGPKLVLPFGELASGKVITPTQWCHILGAHESSKTVVVHVSLFCGPGCVRKPHHVRLGSLTGEIVLPDIGRGHVYFYDKTQPDSGYAGHVEPVSFSRIA